MRLSYCSNGMQFTARLTWSCFSITSNVVSLLLIPWRFALSKYSARKTLSSPPLHSLQEEDCVQHLFASSSLIQFSFVTPTRFFEPKTWTGQQIFRYIHEWQLYKGNQGYPGTVKDHAIERRLLTFPQAIVRNTLPADGQNGSQIWWLP